MSASLDRDQSRVVAIDKTPTVQIKAKAILAAVSTVAGEAAVHIMRQARPFDLVPVHGQVFDVAQPALFEVLLADDQVDDGETTLTSPPMQLRSRYNRPQLAFDYWWLDAISNNAAHDSLVVSISNGKETKPLVIYATDTATVGAWQWDSRSTR